LSLPKSVITIEGRLARSLGVAGQRHARHVPNAKLKNPP
jgi:hypothetical protein